MPSALFLSTLVAFAPAPKVSAEAPLQAVLADVEASVKAGQTPVVVFDLDSTLFDNAPRTKQILLEVAATTDTLRPHAEAILSLPDSGLPYLLNDILATVGIKDPAVTKAFFEGWKQRFFTDAYQLYDRPTPGADAFVRAVHARGATVVYLTGRDAPGMGAGAVDSLRRFGFPVLTPTSVLIMKPRFAEPDEAFKATAVAMVKRLGDVVATFENEPKNANLFAETWPKARSFFVTTNFNPKKAVPVAKSLHRIPDFRLIPVE